MRRSMHLPLTGAVVAVVACLMLAAASTAAAEPVGSQFRVTYQGHEGNTNYWAERPDVAYDPQTNQHMLTYIVSDDDGITIKGQRLDAAGAAVGSEFAISPLDGAGEYTAPSIAYDADHDRFLVVWNNSTNTQVFGQLVASDGTLVGETIVVSQTHTHTYQVDLAWSTDAHAFLVVWKASLASGYTEILGRLVSDSDGTPQASEFQISAMGDNGRAGDHVTIAYNTVDQEFLVAWNGYWSASDTNHVYGQRVGTDGSMLGDNFQISQTTGGSALRPRVVFDSSRDRYLAVFSDDGPSTTWEIYAQFIAGDGTLVGDGFQVSDGAQYGSSWGVNGADLAYDPGSDMYLAAFSSSPHGTGTWSEGVVRADYISGAGELKGNGDFAISQMGAVGNAFRPALDANTVDGEFLALWWGFYDDAGLLYNQGEVWGSRVAVTPAENTVAPVTKIAVSPNPNSYEWWKTDMTVVAQSFGRFDGAADVVDTRCEVLGPLDPIPESYADLPAGNTCGTISTEGGWRVYAASIDSADNTSPVAIRSIALDKTAPTVTPSVSPGSILFLNQPATALAGAGDSGSGVRSSNCGTVDTSATGYANVGCSASDYAGNSNYGSTSYRVAYKPTFTSPTAGATYKLGRTVTVDVALTDYYGVAVAAPTGFSTSLCPVQLSATGAQTLDAVCMKYGKRSKSYQYRMRLGRSGTGTLTLTASVNYSWTFDAIGNDVSVTITQ